MSTETQIDQDPMNTSCDDIDVSYPILPAAKYWMEVKDAKVAPNKAKQRDPNAAEAGDNLEIAWMNSDPATSTKGQDIVPKQVQLTQYISLTPREKHLNDKGREVKAYTPKSIADSITRVVKGCGKSKDKSITPGTVKANPSQLVGWKGLWTVSVQQETSQFPESNRLERITVEAE